MNDHLHVWAHQDAGLPAQLPVSSRSPHLPEPVCFWQSLPICHCLTGLSIVPPPSSSSIRTLDSDPSLLPLHRDRSRSSPGAGAAGLGEPWTGLRPWPPHHHYWLPAPRSCMASLAPTQPTAHDSPSPSHHRPCTYSGCSQSLKCGPGMAWSPWP